MPLLRTAIIAIVWIVGVTGAWFGLAFAVVLVSLLHAGLSTTLPWWVDRAASTAIVLSSLAVMLHTTTLAVTGRLPGLRHLRSKRTRGFDVVGRTTDGA